MEHLEQKQKVTIMIAIMAAMLFAALNQTIVGTALPRIISDIGGMDYYNWVFTVYMLGSSVTAILVGKLSDIYGRKIFILIGIGLFLVASFLNGTSTNITQLIIYRGIQGMAGGVIMSTSFTAVGDLFSPRERGRWQGLMGGIFGLSSVFGPTLGGYIVDNWNWQWVFWIFLPVGVVAFILIVKMFPNTEKRERESVDYFGSVFITLAMIPLLLAFSWAGTTYDWVSFQIIGLFFASVIFFLLFIYTEKKVKSPVLPLELFKNSIFSVANFSGLVLGMGMFGAIMYVPLFVQGVIGTSATQSGFVMMPMTLSMVLTSAVGGQIITKTGKYKLQAILGLAVMTIGLFLLSQMGMESTNGTAVRNMIITGLGLGLSFPIFTLVVQNAVEHRLLGVATASNQLFRQLGGTIGVSIMGTVMSARMSDKMADLANASEGLPQKDSPLAEQFAALKNPQILMNPDQLDALRDKVPEDFVNYFDQAILMLRESLNYALEGVFFVGAGVILIGILLTFFLKEIPLRTSNKKEETKASDNLKHQPSE
ncbi:MDR family MFS transporter [Aquibacillus salsiterrae]|uniref:MFS transporter n=1 Tax=Aquibacillus salsiterrae TaxID=2950439 RepID=A0A9X3WD82_9BACI|nr:MDR family MFS transporter [Aquibacillus salsiterrae]MDC3417477.1 MFS transporter [Aquibacillus salsiterrae]